MCDLLRISTFLNSLGPQGNGVCDLLNILLLSHFIALCHTILSHSSKA